MKAIIVEDEAVAARRLKKIVESLGIEVVANLNSVQNAIKYFKHHEEVDIYFFDIHLSDGLSFDILDYHPLKSPIIFTTAFDQYAIKAFKQNSIDYLLKPIDKEELNQAIEKFRTRNRAAQVINVDHLKQLLEHSQNQKNVRKRYSIKIGDRIKLVEIDEICFFYSENKNNFIATSANRNYPIDQSLDNIFTEISTEDFYKVNRKYIVNIKYIHEIISYSKSRLKLKVGNYHDHEIIVAREKVNDFKSWLG